MTQFINISDDYGDSRVVGLAFYQKLNPDGIFREERDGIYEFQIKGWVQSLLDKGKMSMDDLETGSNFHGVWCQVAEIFLQPPPPALYNVDFFRTGEPPIDTLIAVDYHEIMIYIGDVKSKGYTFYALENLSDFLHKMNVSPLAARTIGLLEIGATIFRVRAERIQ